MPVLLAAAATAVTVSYTTPVIITGVATIGSFIGGYFWRSRRERNKTDAMKSLEQLKKAKTKRQTKRDEAIEKLVETTNHHVKQTSSNTQDIRQQIQQTSKDLEKEKNKSVNANIKLLDITELLGQVSKVLGHEGQLFLTELKTRLTEFTLTHEELIAARDKLAKTAEELQAVVEGHFLVQKLLAEDANLDKKAIQLLTDKLAEAVSTLSHIDDLGDRAEKAKILAENRMLVEQVLALQEQNKKYSVHLKEASHKITALRLENTTLRKTRQSLFVEVEMAKEEGETCDKTSKTRLTMFR